MASTGDAALPSTKEVLCEHLFAVIQTLVVEHADKITGMLTADCPTQDILKLLQDKELLQQRVSKALQVIKGTKHDNEGQTVDKQKEEIGGVLFEKVAEIESELCAQITGMLLELDVSVLHSLLQDSHKLENAVMKAKSEYLRELHPHCLPSKEELGEEIYEVVEQKFPAHASKITGMLLEMDVMKLQQLLDSPTEMDKSIQEAFQTLL